MADRISYGPFTLYESDAYKRQKELTQALQEEQLKRYQEDRMAREYEASRQVMPYENFKIDVGGESVDFRALSPEQKIAWKKQQEANWLMDQNLKMEKYKTEMAKTQLEMDKLGKQRSELQTKVESGNERFGLDILGLGKPYREQISEIEKRIENERSKYMRAGFGAQSMLDEAMPPSYGIPPITKPQPAQLAQQAQPSQQAEQQPAQPSPQQEIKSYADENSARQAGAKAGDIVILQNVKKADGTVGSARVRLTR